MKIIKAREVGCAAVEAFEEAVRHVPEYAETHYNLGIAYQLLGSEISDLLIHDLRHFATTLLFMEGVPDATIRKTAGHRSEELERYKHPSPAFRQQTVEPIAVRLMTPTPRFLAPHTLPGVNP